ncbi:MAG TPA: two-component regulator propeller domain-containing protein [Thermoanaerobaculia bacterium]|jgi:PAS domain S-box-containing protein|nr:two-component regulator propeller domain-containing protein [Thermoanaerobaculia bacterium]
MLHERRTHSASSISLLILAAIFIASPLLALDPARAITQFGLSVWTTDQGLPQSSVNAIAQTKDGYLWFGTQEGLARFDGARFTIFDKRNTPALDTQHITALLVSRDGSLWIGRNGGLTRYKDGHFKSYSQRDGLSDGFIWSLAEGQDGSIWMATYASGVCRFHNGKFTSYRVSDGLPSDSIWSTYTAADGSLWIGTNGGGLSHFSNGTFTNYTTRNGLANNIVWTIHQDRAGDVWIGTNDGLNRLHDGRLTTFTTADGLSNNSAKSIEEDRDGNLWIGTDGGGLNRYSGGKFTSFGAQQGLSDNSVISLYEDLEGSLWVGTSSGGVDQLRPGKFVTLSGSEGLSGDVAWCVREAADGSLLIGTNNGFSRWKDGVMHNLSAPGGLSSNVVRTVLEDRAGVLWLGTADGLDRYDHGKLTVYRASSSELSNDLIRSLAQDREGNIWIGTRGGGLNRFRDGVFTVFNTKNGLVNDVVASIDEDADGSLWIATNGGVSVLKDGRFRNFTARDGLSSETVRVTYHDREGVHWVGTYGGGLNRIKDGRITPITSKDGLFDDVVFSILDDGLGYLWMTCNRGVFRVSRKELNDFADHRIQRIHSISYGVADGMKKAECNGGAPAGWKGKDGQLYFPTGIGVAAIHPTRMWLNSVPPQVWTEEVLLDGKPAPMTADALTIGPGRRSLEIHYTALSFLAPKKVAFRYRLRGFSDEWIDAGDRRVAFYTNLPPGNYLFEVVGSNNDGVWSLARNPLHFRLQAAFYQTYWFWIACAVLLLIAVRAGFTMRLRLFNESERLLVKRVGEQTAELKAAKESAERAAEANKQLSRSKQLILNSAGDGIFGLDEDGIATFVNPSAARMLEWPVEELVGKNLHLLIHADSPDAGLSLSSCEVCSGGAQGATLISRTANFRRRSGRSFPVEYAAGTIVDDGDKGGVVVTFRDVTERLAVEQLKSEFVSTVSHELRTPLTSIRGALGLLSSGMLGPIAEKGHRMLEIAVTNTDRLVRLINDILDLERIDSGKVALTRGPVDAQTVLMQATEGLQSIAEKADVRIVVQAATGTLWGDSDRIIQTLTNLLGNAIKFSPRQGTVTVSGRAEEGDFVFCVADEGRGVPAEKLETIFERFSQVDTSDSRDKGGSGLGLAICESIVAAHGGRIWAEKNDPVGSRFQFTIPVTKEDSQHAA